jgi:hypothetical protein
MRLTNGMGLRSLTSDLEGCAMGRFRVVGGLVREFGLFLKEDRTWWLAPILVALLGLGAFIIFVQGSALAPFIYALF